MSDRDRIGGNTYDDLLLDAAEQQIIERGYEGLAPEDALDRAGVELDGDPPSQWNLFEAVMQRDEDRFNAVVDSAVAKTDSAGKRLLALIEACVVDYDWIYWIELWSLALRDERARVLRERLDTAFRAQIAGLIDDGCSAGEFHVTDSAETAVAIATLIDALAVEATLGDDTVSPNYMLDASSSVAGRLVGAKLKLRGRDDG